MDETRILLLAHGHPDFSPGGGEIAAYTQWQELRRRGIKAMLVCRVSNSPGHIGAPFSLRSADGLEVLFSAPPVDHFRHSQTQRNVVYDGFRALLERFRPTIVHFHHYSHLGLELIREVRKYDASIPIALTLHEFLAICNAHGQMVKTNGMLCQKAAPLDCNTCFPGISPQDFFMRELFVKSFLSLVDLFVCPSIFLRQRYLAWGLPPEKMVVLENGQPHDCKPPAEELADRTYETRFVMLGQLSRRKGTLLLLDAVRLLSKKIRKLIRIEIHGTVQYAEEDFRILFDKGLKELNETVLFCGAYVPQDVRAILQNNGWLIVPSLWWENSPLVIQESFSAGRPVICSNIGGMAEKVTSGVNGVHFRVNSAVDLATKIEECATDPSLWKHLRGGTPRPPTVQHTVDQLLPLYRKAG